MMGMTREEAIRALRVDDGLEIRGDATRLGEFLQGLFVAIAALRFPTREMVERMRGRWIPLNNTQEHFCENCGVSFNLYSYCKNDYNFCPSCGAPMTDEAADMILERMEALHEKT